MPSDFATVLIIDDDSGAALSLVKALKLSLPQFRFHAACTVGKALELFRNELPQAVVLDLHLEAGRGVESGFTLQREILAADAATRVIVLTGHGSLEHGVRALNSGAANFVEKPADIPHLSALLRDAIAQSDLRRAYHDLRREQSAGISSLLRGRSSVMEKLREEIARAACTSQPVLLLGETGTGKGICAQAIHAFGPRSRAKFVRYQPTFGSADLVNSDLFGHVKGSFTGAQSERRGLLLEADGGTVFLDEIEALPIETQVSLLGVLQEKRLRRLGSDSELNTDFRLVCASNEDPEQGLASGKLRKDFYHRIAHNVIRVPTLEARKEDIPELTLFILRRVREREQINIFEIEPAALERLSRRSWPGNVRELEAVVEGAVYRAHVAGRNAICPDDIAIPASVGASQAPGFRDKVEHFKRRLVDEALAAAHGNQVHAARALGIDRSSLRRILRAGQLPFREGRILHGSHCGSREWP